MSSDNQKSSFQDLSDKLDTTFKNFNKVAKVEVHGKPCRAIAQNTLIEYQNFINKALKTCQSAVETESLMKYTQQLSELRSEKSLLSSALAEAKDSVATLKDEINAIKAGNDFERRQLGEAVEELQSRQEYLLGLLKEADGHNSELKASIKALKSSSDVAGAEALSAERVKAAAEVADLHNQLGSVKAELHTARTDFDSRQKYIKDLELKMAQQRGKQMEISEAMEMAKTAAFVKQVPATVEFQSRLVRGILGKTGAEWLQKVELASRVDARERAYALLQATARGTSGPIKSMNQIIEICFKWLKTASFNMRQSVLPWLKWIENDLRAGTLKSAKLYREALEKILASYKQARLSTPLGIEDVKGKREQPAPDFKWHWWNPVHLYGTFSVKYLQGKRAKSFYHPIQGVFGKVSSGFKATFDYCSSFVLHLFKKNKVSKVGKARKPTPPRSKKIVMFDAEDELSEQPPFGKPTYASVAAQAQTQPMTELEPSPEIAQFIKDIES